MLVAFTYLPAVSCQPIPEIVYRDFDKAIKTLEEGGRPYWLEDSPDHRGRKGKNPSRQTG